MGAKVAFCADVENSIILLIWGSFIPSIYYGFAEDMEWVRLYWSMVCCFCLILLRFLDMHNSASERIASNTAAMGSTKYRS